LEISSLEGRSSRWPRTLVGRIGLGAAVVATLLIAVLAYGFFAFGLFEMFRQPSRPFDPRTAPPAPDYSQPQAWLAFPGRNGQERSTPPGFAAIDESKAPADVFFIHPTTYLKNDVWNAPYDASDRQAPFNPPVLLAQISAFNGCCRLYAPNYRQASLAALGKSRPAVALAYADVARAFRYYIAHENRGRPFIIASHSQGSGHAVRLLQQEILGTPLQQRLIAAYVVGAYVPSNFGTLGLPVCEGPRQIGCVVAWNTSEAGHTGARVLTDNPTYWWRGALKNRNQPPAICINPLNWRSDGFEPADTNAGSLPFPKAPFPAGAATLHPLILHLTGAVCRQGLLEVHVPYSAPAGFHDMLTLFMGSYHDSDYGIFYAAIRSNAVDRVNAWLTSNHRPH
jgi:Protein of unknown function (DUF3089)